MPETLFETTIRRRIAEAEADATALGRGGLGSVRERDALALRRILASWEAAITPEGRRAAELGIPTGPHDGGLA